MCNSYSKQRKEKASIPVSFFLYRKILIINVSLWKGEFELTSYSFGHKKLSCYQSFKLINIVKLKLMSFGFLSNAMILSFLFSISYTCMGISIFLTQKAESWCMSFSCFWHKAGTFTARYPPLLCQYILQSLT